MNNAVTRPQKFGDKIKAVVAVKRDSTVSRRVASVHTAHGRRPSIAGGEAASGRRPQ